LTAVAIFAPVAGDTSPYIDIRRNDSWLRNEPTGSRGNRFSMGASRVVVAAQGSAPAI
jgi:hypothetical protein